MALIPALAMRYTFSAVPMLRWGHLTGPSPWFQRTHWCCSIARSPDKTWANLTLHSQIFAKSLEFSPSTEKPGGNYPVLTAR